MSIREAAIPAHPEGLIIIYASKYIHAKSLDDAKTIFGKEFKNVNSIDEFKNLFSKNYSSFEIIDYKKFTQIDLDNLKQYVIECAKRLGWIETYFEENDEFFQRNGAAHKERKVKMSFEMATTQFENENKSNSCYERNKATLLQEISEDNISSATSIMEVVSQDYARRIMYHDMIKNIEFDLKLNKNANKDELVSKYIEEELSRLDTEYKDCHAELMQDVEFGFSKNITALCFRINIVREKISALNGIYAEW